MSAVRAPAPPRATRRQWIGLAVIALPCMLYSMDLTVLNLAVPSLSAALNPSASQLLWIIDIYGFMVAGLLITMGTLGDRIGRRRLLLIGAAAFGVASVLAAFSTSAEMLIAMRALLGIAGATLAPSTLSLIRNMFRDDHERTVAIGVWISSYSVGAAIGPVLGGVLLEYFWWGSVFLLGVPVMVLLLAVGPLLLPEYRDPNAGALDLASAALSLTAVLAVIYGFKRIAEHGLDALPLLCIAAGLVIGALFLRRQAKLSDPLIDLRLFRVPAFGASLAVYMLSCFVLFGAFVFIAQYLQGVLGLSPLHAGLWTVPWALAFVVGSMLTPLAVKRAPPSAVVCGGMVVAAASFALLTQAGATSGLAVIVPATIAMSIGLAPAFTLATDFVVGAAPAERAGAAAAISETSSEFGGALGIAIFGSLGTIVYRGAMADGVPAGVAADVAEAARSTLGAAVAAAAQLPGAAGARLLDAARAAFVDGLQITAIVGAVTLIVTAIAAAKLLRPPPAATAQSIAPRPAEERS